MSNQRTNRSQGKATEDYRIDKGVLLHLHDNVCNNYTQWREFIINHIGVNYPESKGYMEAGVAPVDAVLNEDDYLIVHAMPQWEKDRKNKDREMRSKVVHDYNEKLNKQKIAICSFIVSKLSSESLLAVKTHPNYVTACPVGQDAVGNPHELMRIISEKHFIVQIDKNANPAARRNAFRNDFAAIKLEEREAPVDLVIRLNSFRDQEVLFYNSPINFMPLLMADGAQVQVAVPIMTTHEYVFTYMRLTRRIYPDAYDNWYNTMHQQPFASVNLAHEYCISYKVTNKPGASSVLKTTVKREREDDNDDNSSGSSRDSTSRRKVHFKRSSSRDSTSSTEQARKKKKASQPPGPCRNCERNGLAGQLHWINLCPLKQQEEKAKVEDEKAGKKRKL